jgi:PAS domain S-box-containing protein/putative nucleotidyltransferase with HDIG domain
MDGLVPEAYRFALENTVDSVMITDPHSVVRYVNPAFTTVTGFASEEIIGKKPSVLRSPHTTPKTYAAMWDVILKGGWWRGELINERKNGDQWYAALSISQIPDAQGVPVGYVGISRDITKVKILEKRLREASMEAIYMLSAASEAKDEVTGSHLQRVQHFSRALAEKLGLPPMEAEEIGYSSMMHDVGKMNVPDDVLKKPGPLTDDEWETMKQHPTDGIAILRELPFYETARKIAGAHHEKWDGSGYPLGVGGAEIPLPARIVAVADIFDALTTERPYKAAWDTPKAISEITSMRGEKLDPRVVDAFVELFESGVVNAIRSEFPDP